MYITPQWYHKTYITECFPLIDLIGEGNGMSR